MEHMRSVLAAKKNQKVRSVLIVNISFPLSLALLFAPALSTAIRAQDVIADGSGDQKSSSGLPAPLPSGLTVAKVESGTFEKKQIYFKGLPSVSRLDEIQSMGHDLLCQRYDRTSRSSETSITMPVILESAEGPAEFFSPEMVSMIVIKGLLGSNIPFRFQLVPSQVGLFDIRYMRLALLGSEEYEANKAAIEMKADVAHRRLLINTELINRLTGTDDGIIYVCEGPPIF
jgi:hypothetical protein